MIPDPCLARLRRATTISDFNLTKGRSFMDLPSVIEQGFRTVNADPVYKDAAAQFLQLWLTHSDFISYRPQLEWLIRTGKWSDLLDAFYQVLPFGTGGRRGGVGIGPNRMNLWTLGASVQGHCEYLKRRFPETGKPLHIVLAYDVRQFEDKRKIYNPLLPNPVLHLSSKDFAQYAACVYVANGIHAHILPADSSRYLATPELSYAIRFLHAQGGLNISASHNPPDDNGGKFYEERGGQPVAPEDQIMSELVDEVKQIKSIPWLDAVRGGKIHFLDDATHKAYVELCRRQSVTTPPRFDEFKLVYTPLHGVGSMTSMEALIAQGFRPIPVPEQMEPNGQFPNVTKTPNPEVPECLDRAEVVAREHQAHLLLATDPDADRLGGMACRTPDGKGEYRFLTGNEIAALLTHFKLAQAFAPGPIAGFADYRPHGGDHLTGESNCAIVQRSGRRESAGRLQVHCRCLVATRIDRRIRRCPRQTGRFRDRLRGKSRHSDDTGNPGQGCRRSCGVDGGHGAGTEAPGANGG